MTHWQHRIICKRLKLLRKASCGVNVTSEWADNFHKHRTFHFIEDQENNLGNSNLVSKWFRPNCAIAIGAQIHLFIVNGWTFLLLSFKSIQNCILVPTDTLYVNTQLPIFFFTDRYGNKFLCKCSLGWNSWRIIFFLLELIKVS